MRPSVDDDGYADTTGFTAEIEHSPDMPMPAGMEGGRAWHVKITYTATGQAMTVPYYTGSAITGTPELREILAAVVSDAESGDMSFEDFCGEFGYDTDSRRAYDMWESCRNFGAELDRITS